LLHEISRLARVRAMTRKPEPVLNGMRDCIQSGFDVHLSAKARSEGSEDEDGVA